jgi:DNA-binding MarR family transcriptional regulator
MSAKGTSAKGMGAKGPGFPPASVSRPPLLDGDGRDRSFRATVYDLLTVGARMQAVRDRLAAEMGVTGPQYGILMAVSHAQDEEGGAGVRAIARRLHVSGPFVTAQVNRLVAAGLVEKRPNPADGRGVILRVSAAGRAALDRTAPAIRDANDRFFAPLDRDDFEALSDIAARLVESSEAAVAAFGAGAAEDARR